MMIGAMRGINVTKATNGHEVLPIFVHFLCFSGMFGSKRWRLGALNAVKISLIELEVGQSISR